MLFRSDPDNALTHFRIGLAYRDLGAMLEAEKEFRRALELKHDPSATIPELAQAMLALERFKEVLVDIKPASGLAAPALADIAVARGKAHLRLGAVADARTQFYLGMKERPAESRLGLVVAALAERDAKTAQRLLDELIAQRSEEHTSELQSH
mgnify:CR=1 FL=1